MKMTSEEMERMIHKNERLNLILGYAMGLIFGATLKTSEDEARRKWLLKAVENMCYLDLPLPPMP